METFQKWDILVPELREHSLSYLRSRDLFRYSQCAKVCNAEVQKFNAIAPKTVRLHEFDTVDCISLTLKYPNKSEVELSFEQVDESQYKLDRSYLHSNHFQRPTILQGNAREAALQYFAKCYKYVKTGVTSKMTIHCKRWQMEWNTIPAIYQAQSWDIKVYPCIYQECIRFISRNPNIKKLRLWSETGDSKDLTLPSSFFQSILFRQLDHGVIKVNSSIQDVDFLESPAFFLSLKCDTISYNAINRKIKNWYNGRSECTFTINFITPRMITWSDFLFDIPAIELSVREAKIVRPDGESRMAVIYNDMFAFLLIE